jgi:hypothetical protein
MHSTHRCFLPPSVLVQFSLEGIDPEAQTLHGVAAEHLNGTSTFSKVIVVQLSATKENPLVAAAGEFVDASVKRAAASAASAAADHKALFDAGDIDHMVTALWRVIAITKDDQVTPSPLLPHAAPSSLTCGCS